MPKRDKRIERMRRNPHAVRPDHLDAALIAAGFSSHQEGSHKTYRRDGEMLTVPQRKPFLKSVYVLMALQMLETQQEAEDVMEGDGGENEADGNGEHA